MIFGRSIGQENGEREVGRERESPVFEEAAVAWEGGREGGRAGQTVCPTDKSRLSIKNRCSLVSLKIVLSTEMGFNPYLLDFILIQNFANSDD